MTATNRKAQYDLRDWIPILKAIAQSLLPSRPPTRGELAAVAKAEPERHITMEAKEA